MIIKTLHIQKLIFAIAITTVTNIISAHIMAAETSGSYATQYSSQGVINSLDIANRNIVVGDKEFDLSYSLEVHNPYTNKKVKLDELSVGMKVGCVEGNKGTLSEIWMLDGLD